VGDTSSHGVSLVTAGSGKTKAQARFPTILDICVSRSRYLEYNFFSQLLITGPHSEDLGARCWSTFHIE